MGARYQLKGIRLTGIEEVKRAFKELEPKLARKVIRQAERKAMKMPLAVARVLVPVKTGDVKSTLRVRASKGPRSMKKPIAIALLIGGAMTPQWYGWLQDQGYHVGGKRIRSGGKTTGYKQLRAGVAVRRMPGRHFMKRALKRTEEPMKALVAAEIVAGIEREARA